MLIKDGGQEVLKLKTYLPRKYPTIGKIYQKIDRNRCISSCVSINLQVTSILSSDRISTVTHLIGQYSFISQNIAHKHMYLLGKLS